MRLIPNDYVVIITLSGESKRFPMSEVEYAGPASPQPQPQPQSYPEPEPVAPAAAPKHVGDDDDVRPEITVHAEEARLTLTSSPSGHTFHKQHELRRRAQRLSRGSRGRVSRDVHHALRGVDRFRHL